MIKTPISILQELMMQKKDRLPDYFIENDDHGPYFKCTVTVSNIKAVGYASSKKDAKQNSAKKALEILNAKHNYNMPEIKKLGFGNTFGEPEVRQLTKDSLINRKALEFVNYVGRLNEFAAANYQPQPIYTDVPVPTENGVFVAECKFLDFVSQGFGLKKKEAKHEAAHKMLEMLKNEDISVINYELQNLHLEKEKRINNLTLQISKKYEELSANDNNVQATATTTLPLIQNIKKTCLSLEDLETEMVKYGYKYMIETFQKDPYIVMMKITDTNVTIMGSGKDKQEAMRDLFESVQLMFFHDFSFKCGL